MADDGAGASIIRRKIAGAANRPKPAGASMPMAVFEELARRLERARRPRFGAIGTMRFEEMREIPVSDALGALKDDPLIGVAMLTETGRQFLVVFDAALGFHVVDLLLGGEADGDPALPTRTATALDKAVAGRAIEAVAADFLGAMRGDALPDWRLSGVESEPKMAGIAADDSPAIEARFTVSLGAAPRTGTMTVILPVATADGLGPAVTLAVSAPSASNPWALRMRRAALDAELEVVAAVGRTEMTVAELSRLDIGQLLPLADGALQGIALTIETPDGPIPLAEGRLGAHQNRKAVKLHDAPDPAFLAPVRGLIAE